jgi:hypothetical protein
LNRKGTADDSKSFAMKSRLLFFDRKGTIFHPSRAVDDSRCPADDSSRAVIDSSRLFYHSRSTADDSKSLADHRECLADDSILLTHDSILLFHDFRRKGRLPSPRIRLALFVRRPCRGTP